MMSEYHCYPLWEVMSDGLKNFEAYNLEIPKDLARRIEEWGDAFESTYQSDDPASSGFRTEEGKEEFIRQGLTLLQELRVSLNEEFELEYRALNGEKIKL